MEIFILFQFDHMDFTKWKISYMKVLQQIRMNPIIYLIVTHNSRYNQGLLNKPIDSYVEAEVPNRNVKQYLKRTYKIRLRHFRLLNLKLLYLYECNFIPSDQINQFRLNGLMMIQLKSFDCFKGIFFLTYSCY